MTRPRNPKTYDLLKWRVGYVCIEAFGTAFDMGDGGGGTPPPWVMAKKEISQCLNTFKCDQYRHLWRFHSLSLSALWKVGGKIWENPTDHGQWTCTYLPRRIKWRVGSTGTVALVVQYTECAVIYRESVLHLLKYRFAVYLSRCSTDLR